MSGSDTGSFVEYGLAIGLHKDKAFNRLYIVLEGNVNYGKSISETLKKKIKLEYGHVPAVGIVSPGKIPRSPGKAKRVFSFEELDSILILSSGSKWM